MQHLKMPEGLKENDYFPTTDHYTFPQKLMPVMMKNHFQEGSISQGITTEKKWKTLSGVALQLFDGEEEKR